MVRKIENRSLVYVPGASGPHPVLCFLHGAGEAAADRDGLNPQSLDAVLAHGSPGWHAENITPFVSRFLVICPQLGRTRRWEPSDAEWVDGLVAQAVGRNDGDVSHLVMSGFSRGGEGAFQLASASGHRWQTIWAVDPALQRMPPQPADDVRVWVHYGLERPGGANMQAFATALGLASFKGDMSASRLVTALKENHVGTARAAFATGLSTTGLLHSITILFSTN